MSDSVDIANLTRDELEEEFRYLQSKCKQLKEASEEDAQRIHELKRNLDTAIAAEQYLSQELEQLTGTNNSVSNLSSSKLQDEYNELRRKHKDLELEFSTLQEDNDALTSEHAKLLSKLEQLTAENEKNNKADTNADYEKLIERLQVLEYDNMELLQKFDEQQALNVKQSMLLAEKEKHIELMQDEIMCLEENMRYKREDLEEKTRLLEGAQEQLCEANAKINMLMTTPENKDRKGNSLFAEVDDQRQAMLKMLASHKKNYQEMKKIYNESQYEIRRLKRENSAMHNELQACSAIFRNADRTYQEKLSGRIKFLLNENDTLEKKLKRTQDNLRELANERGVSWLDSMLNFCKQETDDLKKQLFSMRIQNASLEEQLRNEQKEMARWRFESLKSRCLLIDRENMLTEHKIEFKPQNYIEYDITAEEIEKARPRIVPVEQRKSISNEDSVLVIENVENSNAANIKNDQSLNVTTNSIILINDSIVCNDKENSQPSTPNLSAEMKHKRSPLSNKPDLNQMEKPEIVSPQLQIKTVEDLNLELEQVSIKEKESKNLRPSILCKERALLTDASDKKVKFAANEVTVYNLPASPTLSNNSVTSDDSLKESKINIKSENENSIVVKTMRTKSNVLVRRIIVNSKSK